MEVNFIIAVFRAIITLFFTALKITLFVLIKLRLIVPALFFVTVDHFFHQWTLANPKLFYGIIITITLCCLLSWVYTFVKFRQRKAFEQTLLHLSQQESEDEIEQEFMGLVRAGVSPLDIRVVQGHVVVAQNVYKQESDKK